MNSLHSPANTTTRRRILAGAAVAAAAAAVLSPAALIGQHDADLDSRLTAIAARCQGRLGCAVLDLDTGRQGGVHSGELFPMCSTFKLLAAALILYRVDRGEEHLERKVRVAKQDLLGYSPVVEKSLAAGSMSVAELCEAAMTWSDNAAANLLLASFGGPAAVTAFLRSTGDTVTRLDRNEPSLNESRPGDPRDTTSPAAMVQTLRRLTLDSVLKPASRSQFCDWLIANHTGDARLRAGLPQAWKIGDKTGTGNLGTTNDVAIAWRPGGKPLLIAAYLTECTLPAPEREAIIADIGRTVANWSSLNRKSDSHL